MGKYTTYKHTPPKPRNLGVHPVMRGIGCIMMIVVPILSYGTALLLIDYGIRKGWPLPPNWLQPISIPPLLLRLRGLDPIWNFLLRQDNLIAVVVFTVAIIVVIGGLMSVLYGYIYSLFGPPQYGPQDAPPIRVKVKRYKR
ncbi:MAG TPA: hypothetical protein VFG81_14825 [Anaerolineales bacterium]|jgi:hypothetical protein|nr:hypothetical protein [Anaerolineales bacterium]